MSSIEVTRMEFATPAKMSHRTFSVAIVIGCVTFGAIDLSAKA